MLPLNHNDQIHTFNHQLAKIPLLLPLSMPISLIGFPQGKASFQKLPFWITGFISSEYAVDEQKLFVNVPGRSGLSGSPVISRQFGGFSDALGNIFNNGMPRDSFVGIYSGRIHKDSDVGYVWKPLVINQILQSRKTKAGSS